MLNHFTVLRILRRDSMTYNERYQVKRLPPDTRRRNAETAARQRDTQARRSIPHQTIADDLPGYDDEGDEWDIPRMPTVTRRYDLQPGSYEEYYHPQPLRRSTVAPPQPRRRVQPHWLLYVGVALFLVLIGYVVLTDFGNWWQGHQDDATYGMPRTFQVDAVVGHNDSAAHPSHFTAENLKGAIFVIELPGGDITKARSYPITTIPGNDASVPAKVLFQDTTNDGKLDMVVIIGDPGSQVTITLYNDGTQFTGKHP
jgi:hypothetical protein